MKDKMTSFGYTMPLEEDLKIGQAGKKLQNLVAKRTSSSQQKDPKEMRKQFS